MHDLRLIGVHEDGAHLLLSDADGARYRVPLDEPLRAAARRDRAHLGQLQIDLEGGLRPREVQALIRSGLSSDEVADRAGWTIEKVRRFEGPVLAEREHIANQARSIMLSSPSAGSRAGSGRDEPAQTLGERAHARFQERGVAEERVRWDSARRDDGQWTVTVHFAAGGRERSGSWRFDPRLRSLFPTNDEARWLSEGSGTDGAIPTPHTAQPPTHDTAVFDVEAAGGVHDTTDADAEPASETAAPEPVDLMAKMREQSTRSRRHRARVSKRSRQGPAATPLDDRPREDALPLEELALDPAQAPEPPAARDTHPVHAHLDQRDHSAVPDEDTEPEAHDHDDLATADEPPAPRGGSEAEPDADAASASASGRARTAKGRKGRASVPSWDDIMFGGRSGNS